MDKTGVLIVPEIQPIPGDFDCTGFMVHKLARSIPDQVMHLVFLTITKPGITCLLDHHETGYHLSS